jgi:hypothetical protein
MDWEAAASAAGTQGATRWLALDILLSSLLQPLSRQMEEVQKRWSPERLLLCRGKKSKTSF